jgi:predicted HTH transcriptional regulator
MHIVAAWGTGLPRIINRCKEYGLPDPIAPFAVNDGVTVYLDESLKRFETVFPACGSSNSAIELTMEELEKYSGYTA